jgi:hypothetical protein
LRRRDALGSGSGPRNEVNGGFIGYRTADFKAFPATDLSAR